MEFELQQLVWMAIRESPAPGQVRYSPVFLQFLSENLGSAPTGQASDARAFSRMEAAYNPCVSRGPNSPLRVMKKSECSA